VARLFVLSKPKFLFTEHDMSNHRSPLDQPQYPFSGPGFPYAPAQGGAPSAAYPTGYVAPGPNGYGPGQYPPGQYPPGTYAQPQQQGMGLSQPVRQQGPGNPMAYPQGNTFQDQFLAERTPGEMARLDALSRQAAEQLGPQTILRPFIVPRKITGILLNTLYDDNLDTNIPGPDDQYAEFTLEYYFPFAVFIRKITATLVDPILNKTFADQLLAADSPFGGDVSALDYIEGKLERANNENIFTDYAPLSEWCGTGQLSYVWDLIPYISRAETIRINCRIPKIIPYLAPAAVPGDPGPARYYFDYIGAVNITLHTMRFPAP
jgi:hypothetical protein